MKQTTVYILLLLLTACQSKDRLDMALEYAGDNRAELEKVLEHYRGDEMKYRAARFLIENMPYHFSSVEYFWKKGEEHYYPDITQHEDASAVSAHCDSLLSCGWTIRQEKLYDIQQIKATYLIQNIDLAFDVWHKPWGKDVSFDDFCRYILPYRAQNEVLSSYRETLMQKYIHLLDSAQAENTLDACKLINKQLNKDIRYKETGNPLSATIEETYRSGIGTCEALCNYTISVMRAVGIPVAVQQTTWTRMDRGHVWCAVLYNGQFFDFNPGDIQPDKYQDILVYYGHLKPAKVYRRNFEVHLPDTRLKDDGYVTYLKKPLLTDATQEQKQPVYTLKIPTDKKETNKKTVYLCAFNMCQWVPIAMGIQEDGYFQFNQVAGKNIFIVAEATGKHSLAYVSAPLLVEKDGSFRFLTPDSTHFISHTFKSKPENLPYTLYYWDTSDKTFQTIPCTASTDTTLYYQQIPDNALLWYKSGYQKRGQAIGILINDEYVTCAQL